MLITVSAHEMRGGYDTVSHDSLAQSPCLGPPSFKLEPIALVPIRFLSKLEVTCSAGILPRRFDGVSGSLSRTGGVTCGIDSKGSAQSANVVAHQRVYGIT